MRRILMLFFGLLCGLRAMGQQEAMYSQYMFNKLSINPAYAGNREVSGITALFRAQWVGINGAPETKTISYDGLMPNKKVGLGFQAFNYKMGITNLNGGFVSYAYRINFVRSTLAFGLQGGASQIKADLNSVNLRNPNPDEAFLNNLNEVFINFGAGLFFNTERFYFGLSSPHLLKNRLRDNNQSTADGQFTAQEPHIFVTSGYLFNLSDDFILKPSFLFKRIHGSPVELDLNTNLYIMEIFSIGAQYRTKNALAGMAEIQITPQIRMGYSYERSTTRLVEFNSGTHEIMLRFEFKNNNERLINPRYF